MNGPEILHLIRVEGRPSRLGGSLQFSGSRSWRVELACLRMSDTTQLQSQEAVPCRRDVALVKLVENKRGSGRKKCRMECLCRAQQSCVARSE